LGERYLYCAGGPTLLFTENETNAERIFKKPNASPWVKDAIDRYVVQGKKDAVNPAQIGTKLAAHYQITVEAGTRAAIRLRRSRRLGSRAVRARFRRRGRAAAAGVRPVLRLDHAALGRRRQGSGHASGAGGDAVEQAVLLLRRGRLAQGARNQSILIAGKLA